MVSSSFTSTSSTTLPTYEEILATVTSPPSSPQVPPPLQPVPEPDFDEDEDDSISLYDQIFGDEAAQENAFNESIYTREDVINIFTLDEHPGFVTEIQLIYQEGEHIPNIELYEILGVHNLELPGFEFHPAIADSMDNSYQDIENDDASTIVDDNVEFPRFPQWRQYEVFIAMN